MKQIVIVKPGTISAKDKEKLSKNGYVVVEHQFPGDVRIVDKLDIPDVTDGNEIFWSAIHGVYSSELATKNFANSFLAKIKAKEKK